MVSRLKFILKPRPRLKRYRFGGTSYCWTITMKVIYFIQLAIIVAVFMWSIKIIFSNFVFNDDRLTLLDENVGIKGRSSGQRVELPMPEEELFPSTTTVVATIAETTTTTGNVTTTNVPDSTMATDVPSIKSTTESESDPMDPIDQTTSIDMSTDFLSFFTENPTTQSELDLGTTQSEPADSTRSNDADSESSASTIRPEIGSSSAATTTFASTLDAFGTEVPESLSTDSGSSAGTTGSTINLQTEIPETGGPSSTTAAIDSTFDLVTEVPQSPSTDIPLAESTQTTTIGDTFELATEVPPSPGSPEIPSTDFSTSSVASVGPAETMAVPTTESLAYTEGVVTEQAEVTDGQAEVTEQAEPVPTSTANAVPTAFETFDDVSTPPNEPISTTAPTESTERIDIEVDRTIPSSFDQNGATTTTTSSTTVVPTSSASASALTEESNIEDFATTTTTLFSNTLPSVDVVTSLDESTIGPGNSITTRSVSDDVDEGESTTTPVPTTTITPQSIATDVPDSGSDVPVAVNTTSRSFVEYSSESSAVDSGTTTTTMAPRTVPPNIEVTTSSPTMTTTTTSGKPTTPFSKTAPAKPNHHHNHNHRPKWMRFWPNNPPTGWNAKLPPCPPPGPPSGPSDGGWGPSDQQEPATMESPFFGSGQTITSQIHKLWTRMFRLNQFRCEISQERRVIQYGLIQALDQYRAKLSKEILALSETLKQDDRWYWPNMMPNSNKVQEELIRLNQLLQLTTQYFKVLNRFNYFEWLQN